MKGGNWIYSLPVTLFLLLNYLLCEVKVLFICFLIYIALLISLFFLLRIFVLEKMLLYICGGASLILFVYGVIQRFILFPIYLADFKNPGNYISDTIVQLIETKRIYTIFTLPTLYAIICALLVIGCLHYLIKTRVLLAKLFWGFLILLGIFNLILTQSFGGVLSLCLGAVTYLLSSKILKIRHLAPVIMGLSMVFFIVVGLRFSDARKLEPVKLRLTNWGQALRMISDNSLFGVGLGNYEAQSAWYLRKDEARTHYAHNSFLQFFAETGFFLFSFLALLLFLNLKKFNARDLRSRALYFGCLASLLLYNLIDIGIYYPVTGIMGAIILSQIFPRTTGSYKVLLIPVVILTVLFSAVTLSDDYFISGELHLSQKQHRVARHYYEKSLKLNPANFKSMAGLAYLFMIENDQGNARKQLNQALQIFPQFPFANYLKSRLEIQKGKYLSSLYHASLAYRRNHLNEGYKRWYESVKNTISANLSKSKN